jgi:hypothetical protein
MTLAHTVGHTYENRCIFGLQGSVGQLGTIDS